MKKVICLFFILSLLLNLAGCTFFALHNGDITQTANSPEEIFKSFFNGKVTAATEAGETVDIDIIKGSAADGFEIKYTLFDRNGDSIPELAVNNGADIFTFWINGGNIE